MSGLIDAIQSDELPLYNSVQSLDDRKKLLALAAARRKNPSFQSTGAAASRELPGGVVTVGNPWQGVLSGLTDTMTNVYADRRDQAALEKSKAEQSAFNQQFSGLQDSAAKEKALLTAPSGVDTELAAKLYGAGENRAFQNQNREDAQQARKEYLADQTAARLEQQRLADENRRAIIEAQFGYNTQRDATKHGYGMEKQNDAQQFKLTLPGATTPKSNNALVKMGIENQQNLNLIQNAEDAIKKNPDALGFKNYMPDSVTQRVYPGNVDTLSTLAQLNNITLKSRSGAAVTEGEMARFMKEAPSPTDTPEAAQTKLSNMRRMAEQNGYIIENKGQSTVKTPPQRPAHATDEQWNAYLKARGFVQ